MVREGPLRTLMGISWGRVVPRVLRVVARLFALAYVRCSGTAASRRGGGVGAQQPPRGR